MVTAIPALIAGEQLCKTKITIRSIYKQWILLLIILVPILLTIHHKLPFVSETIATV
jgi:hypothetical protein